MIEQRLFVERADQCRELNSQVKADEGEGKKNKFAGI